MKRPVPCLAMALAIVTPTLAHKASRTFASRERLRGGEVIKKNKLISIWGAPHEQD